MACDSSTLIAAAAAKGFQALSARQLKECALYAICAGSAVVSGYTAQQLLTAAVAAGYQKLSDRAIDEAILAALCP